MNFYQKTIMCVLFFSLVVNAIGQESKTVGLIQYDTLSYNGYTLFSPMSSNSTYLIDNCGQKIKEWTFEGLPALLAYLQEDGSIFRAERTSGTFGAGGSGGRIVHKSWDDQLIWSYIYSDNLVRHHHDFQVLPNGNVLLLAWERKTQEEAIQAGRIPSFTSSDGVWFEHIVELKPIGIDSADIIWEWHVFDHLVQERDPSLENFGQVSLPNRFHINYNVANQFSPTQPGNADWMHMNSIQYNEARDEIMLSSRDFNEIYVIDHSTTTEEASSNLGGNSGKGGDILFRWGNNAAFDKGDESDQKLSAQHHASWTDNVDFGNARFTVFNNGLGSIVNDLSSVEIVRPLLIDGTYVLSSDGVFMVDEHITISDTDELDFSSARLSSVQLLANENILIASGNNGRIIEITPDEEKVWDYINPINNSGPITQGNNASSNDIFRGIRYSLDYKAFDGQLLFPSGILEIDLESEECFIIDTTTSTTNVLLTSAITIFPNPVTNFLRIEYSNEDQLYYELYNLSGKLLKDGLTYRSVQVDVQDYPSGFYMLKIRVKNQIKLFKVIKE